MLYRVTVYHLFGQAFGFLVVAAHDINALRDMAVNADEIGVVPGHHALALKPWRAQPLAHLYAGFCLLSPP